MEKSMAWAKLDDQFFEHRKVIDTSKDAKLLYLAALTKSAAQLTDGFISPAMLRVVVAIVDVPTSCTQELIKAELWEAVDGGYQIHDYHAYNPSAEKVRREREQTAQRQRDFVNRARQNNGVSDSVSNVNPVPVPTTRSDATNSSELVDRKNGAIAPANTSAPDSKKKNLRKRKPKPGEDMPDDHPIVVALVENCYPNKKPNSTELGRAKEHAEICIRGEPNVTPEIVKQYAENYRHNMPPHIPLTPRGLVSNWSASSERKIKPGAVQPAYASNGHKGQKQAPDVYGPDCRNTSLEDI